MASNINNDQGVLWDRIDLTNELDDESSSSSIFQASFDGVEIDQVEETGEKTLSTSADVGIDPEVEIIQVVQTTQIVDVDAIDTEVEVIEKPLCASIDSELEIIEVKEPTLIDVDNDSEIQIIEIKDPNVDGVIIDSEVEIVEIKIPLHSVLDPEVQIIDVKVPGCKVTAIDPEVQIIEKPDQDVVNDSFRCQKKIGDDGFEVIGVRNQTRLPHLRCYCTDYKCMSTAISIKNLTPYPILSIKFNSILPINESRHQQERFCDLCYCYVCDIPAVECKRWNIHCYATDLGQSKRFWRRCRYNLKKKQKHSVVQVKFGKFKRVKKTKK